MIKGTWARIAVGLLVAGVPLAAGWAEEPASKPVPETFRGIMTVVNGPQTGIVRMRLAMDRWSTVEERKAYGEAIKTGDNSALVTAMEKVTVGYVQFDQNLRYPISYGIKVPTDKGELIRVATRRPISVRENVNGFVSRDYPIGVMEFVIGPDGKGKGTILAATNVKINDKGQLEVKSLPQNTGPQLVSEFERDVEKSKKDKK